MTLTYTTSWPAKMGIEFAGKSNHFVGKIWTGILQRNSLSKRKDEKLYVDCKGKGLIPRFPPKPKIHTFRKDTDNRWKVGMHIHPVINNRTKDRFQFAPVLEVEGLQKIEIKITSTTKSGAVSGALIFIDDKYYCGYFLYGKLFSHDDLIKLVENDGFPSPEAFFSWFNTDFTGKIIHWTGLKY